MAGASIVYTKKELEIRQIRSDESVSEQMYDFLCGLANEWGIHVRGIALIGGKPYPMQAALFQMFDNKREKEKLIVAGWETKPIQRATQQELRAGYECIIKLFDKGCFDEATKKIAKENMTVEMVEKLRATYTYTFREEGWGSIQTVKMPAMQNVDYLCHMSATRAIDRTLRLIVRCPYTAASELPEGAPDGSVTVSNPGYVPAPSSPPEGGVMLSRPKPKDQPLPVEPPQQEVPKQDLPKVDPPKVSVPAPVVPEEPKVERVTDKQIALLTGRWSEYVKRRVSGLKGPQIDAKLDRLIRALWEIEKKDLVPAQIQELLGYMERAEIEVVMDEEPKEEKAAVAVSKPAEKA